MAHLLAPWISPWCISRLGSRVKKYWNRSAIKVSSSSAVDWLTQPFRCAALISTNCCNSQPCRDLGAPLVGRTPAYRVGVNWQSCAANSHSCAPDTNSYSSGSDDSLVMPCAISTSLISSIVIGRQFSCKIVITGAGLDTSLKLREPGALKMRGRSNTLSSWIPCDAPRNLQNKPQRDNTPDASALSM